MSSDPTRDALHRLMADAAQGGQAKVDALIALSQRTFYVPQLPGHGGFRTLVSPSRESALAVFTGLDTLEAAAQRFGWREPDGSVRFEEVGARHAFNHLLAHDLAYIVVDIGQSHGLEAARDEIEPLLVKAAHRDSTGPFAGTGRISSSMLKRVRPSSTPPPGLAVQEPALAPRRGVSEEGPTPSVGPLGTYGAARRISEPAEDSPPAPPSVASSTVPNGATVLRRPETAPSDDLLAALAGVLREYPECEWAVYCTRAESSSPVVGVRLATNFRTRLDELARRLAASAQAFGAVAETIVLDDAGLARSARREGIPFFPWRRRI